MFPSLQLFCEILQRERFKMPQGERRGKTLQMNNKNKNKRRVAQNSVKKGRMCQYVSDIRL